MNNNKFSFINYPNFLSAVFASQLILAPVQQAQSAEMQEIITIYGSYTGSLFVEVYYEPRGGMPSSVKVHNSPFRGGGSNSNSSKYYLTENEEEELYKKLYDKTEWTQTQVDSLKAELEVFIEAYDDLLEKGDLPQEMVNKLTKAVKGANTMYSTMDSLYEISSYALNKKYAESIAAIAAVAVSTVGVSLGVIGVATIGGAGGLLVGSALAVAGVIAGERARDFAEGQLDGFDFVEWVNSIARRLDVPSWEEGSIEYIEHVCDLYPGYKWATIPGCDSAVPVPPIFIDLNNKGVKQISSANSNIEFDVNLDGTKELMPWVAPSAPVLFLDINASGTLDDAREFMFSKYSMLKDATDLDGLKTFDVNGDNSIDLKDGIYKHLYLWADKNGDGVSQASEVISLSSLDLNLEIEGHDVNEYKGEVRIDKRFEVTNDRGIIVGKGWSVTLIGEAIGSEE